MNRFRTLKRFAIFLSVLVIVGGIFSYAMAEEPSVTTSLMVKMVAGLSQEERAEVIAGNGGVETSSIPALRLHVIEVPTDQLSTTMQNYRDDPRVVSVEENKERKAEGDPSDTDYGSQWALPKIGWDQAFGTITPTGSSIVAILDTGVDSTHTELAGKLITCTSILNGSDCTSDPHGHGTWLAGIIAANTDNNNGIAGVGYDGVKIMPVTVLSAGGTGQDSDIIAGVIWAADNGADVILMGFSNPGFSQNLQDAIDYAWSKNVVIVAATGNDGVTTPTYPAGDRGVIGVSATDQSDNFVSFSNYGQDVFLAAPGINIPTTNPMTSVDTYVTISGTSASSAIVAGVAAFTKAVDPTLTNGVIVGRLARNADPAGTLDQIGNGRVNMARALADTGIEPIQPAGAAPVGNGGPYVGPYVAATQPHNVNFATSGLPNNVSITVTWTKKNSGGDNCTTNSNVNGSTTFNTPGPSGNEGTCPSTTFTYSFPGSVTVSGVTYNFQSGSPTSGFTTGSIGATTTVTATYALACTAPSISGQPAGATKTVGESVTFSVTASGTAPLSYQWRKNSSNITGATSSSYTILSVVTADAGSYDVVVSNSCGVTTSSTATLTVNKATPTATLAVNNSPQTYNGLPQAATVSISVSSVPGAVAQHPHWRGR